DLVVRNHHQLADEPLADEVRLGLVEVRQLVGAPQQRLDLSFLYVPKQTAERAARALRGAVELQMLQVHRAQVKLDERTGDRPGCRVASFRPQNPQQVAEQRAARQIGHHVDV